MPADIQMIKGTIPTPLKSSHLKNGVQRNTQGAGGLHFLPSFATYPSGDLEEVVSSFSAADSIYLSRE